MAYSEDVVVEIAKYYSSLLYSYYFSQTADVVAEEVVTSYTWQIWNKIPKKY